MLAGATYGERLGLLLAVLGALALLDWWRRGRAATRWREYLALLAAGGLGAGFGLAVDQVTVSLSAEYFSIGKELGPGPGLRWRVVLLGLQAGFTAGAIVGGIYLLSAQPERCPGRPGYRGMLQALGWPILGAPLAAGLGGVTARWWVPQELRATLELLMPQEAVQGCLRVWGIHLGLYGGGLVGSLVGAWRLWRARAGAKPYAEGTP